MITRTNIVKNYQRVTS